MKRGREGPPPGLAGLPPWAIEANGLRCRATSSYPDPMTISTNGHSELLQHGAGLRICRMTARLIDVFTAAKIHEICRVRRICLKMTGLDYDNPPRTAEDLVLSDGVIAPGTEAEGNIPLALVGAADRVRIFLLPRRSSERAVPRILRCLATDQGVDVVVRRRPIVSECRSNTREREN